ncbi:MULTISPECIES: thiol:disulfide interchange protein DsbA/DsbL [Vibrio]|uniref:Thiol-disulfide isomerase n=1 Tax=Vibrio bivalvicida TaxID=1276888 RepID=A0A177Y5G3_9VIBR|nr:MULTISPECIES: thiol:disulfide interchange protein DsbA/DsbL [Vibrio]KLN63714.1 thiol-disulfide isomerase and thioredoxin [Vibrio sp. VPAP30]OAJ95846.1 thiol-disulfide isomerase [Vibrio bivalvicida]
MKKIASFLIIVVAALIVGCSDNSQPVEGKQYQQLPTNLSTFKLPQVTEVFSLNCGHCRQMENEIPEIEKLTGQSIGKVHVTFNESAQIGAMIYYAAEMQLGNKPDHTMMSEMFTAIQMGDGATPAEKKAALDLVFHSRDLISPYDFNEEQQQQLFAAMQIADDITTKGQINAVPTFIVNGKYQIMTSGHQDVAGIASTINFLLTQP